jgi:hypothetical protein
MEDYVLVLLMILGLGIGLLFLFGDSMDDPYEYDDEQYHDWDRRDDE